MNLFKKAGVQLALLLFLFYSASAQECDIRISGKIIDEHDQSGLSYATISIEETSQGSVCDENGSFELSNICPGNYHIVATHIGCEPARIFVKISGDTSINFFLEHHATQLEAVSLKGSRKRTTIQNQHTIQKLEINEIASIDVSKAIENVTGVRTIKNGSGFGKPVVNGLYGNRIAVINNGILQGGQSWGSDHTPEVDPFAANQITVVKGVDALEYAGSGLGGMILIEPGNIALDPHLHGQATYQFQSNGRSHLTGLQMERGGSKLRWRVNGTYQRRGDMRSPDYYLTNTGVDAQTASLQLEKSWKNKLFAEGYYSFYNMQQGVLRGAHLGNLTDLQDALDSDLPFGTKEEFSFEINAPYQKIIHHLAKMKFKYFIGKKSYLEYKYGYQFNNRREFDIRRSGRSDIPALFLRLRSHYNDVVFNKEFSKKISLKLGFQYLFRDNENDPETGILPLIPDYVRDQFGTYAKLSINLDNTILETGIRVDQIGYFVQYITREIPRRVQNYDLNFTNISGHVGIEQSINETLTANFQTGYARRNPEVNELFSNGLHQGVAGIEQGDPDLGLEESFKSTISFGFDNDNELIEIAPYGQYFKDYIYLRPSGELRSTIRGTFPVFNYVQNNAIIYGIDFRYEMKLLKDFILGSSYSVVRGEDLDADEPLIYIPADKISAEVTYKIPTDNLKEDFSIKLQLVHVFEQWRYTEGSDFLAPPPGYSLWNLQLNSKTEFFNNPASLFLRIDNLFNKSYRDYLNRLRYFADDTGVNITIGYIQKF